MNRKHYLLALKHSFHNTFLSRNHSICYGLNCVPQKKVCWSPSPQELRTWPGLEITSLQIVRMRSQGGPLIQRDYCPYKKWTCGDRDTQGDGHSTEIGVAQLQGRERRRLMAKHQKPGTCKAGLLQRLQRKCGPANNLTSDFCLELCGRQCVFVVLNHQVHGTYILERETDNNHSKK